MYDRRVAVVVSPVDGLDQVVGAHRIDVVVELDGEHARLRLRACRGRRAKGLRRRPRGTGERPGKPALRPDAESTWPPRHLAARDEPPSRLCLDDESAVRRDSSGRPGDFPDARPRAPRSTSRAADRRPAMPGRLTTSGRSSPRPPPACVPAATRDRCSPRRDSRSDVAGVRASAGSSAFSLAHVQADSYDHGFIASLCEDTRDLSSVDEDVVRPLDSRGSSERRRSTVRASRDPATSDSSAGALQAGGRSSKETRSEVPGGRLPGAPEPSASCRLLVADGDRALGQVAVPAARWVDVQRGAYM